MIKYEINILIYKYIYKQILWIKKLKSGGSACWSVLW